MTESLARISARRPWLTIAAWVVVLLIGFVLIDRLLGSATTTEPRLTGNIESNRAEDLLEERLRGPKPVLEVVVVQSESLTVDDPAFRERVEALFAKIEALPPGVVTAAQHYYQGSDAPVAIQPPESLVSADGRTTILPLILTGDLGEATDNVHHILELVENANAEGDGFLVHTGGEASVALETTEIGEEDLRQGESIGVLIALVVLLVLFGAVVAALLPLGLAVVSIVIALGLVALIGQAMELVFSVTLMVTMIGLAVGIDYSLLVVSRFKEELRSGLNKREAAVKAGATAGRTVLFSGVTVVIALVGLVIVPASFFQSIGIGAILVVLVALASTLTLLPAVLALLGTRVNFLSLPFLNRAKATSGAGETPRQSFWDWSTRVVTRFPVISIVLVAAPLIALAAFYFQINTGLNGIDTFPDDAQTKQAFTILEEAFPIGLASPADIVIDGDIGDPQVRAAIDDLRNAIAGDPRFPIPLTETVNPAGDLAWLEVIIPGEPSGEMALDAVSVLRDEYIPAAFEGVPAEVYVGGTSAFSEDLFDVAERYTPIVFAFVLGFSFIALMVVFRSIVIPIKVVIMNLISVGAAYGLMVLVFQKGVATDLLGFQHMDAIDVWIPLFLFSVLFGLSMDYHVFLLSRIRERYDQTGENAEAVAYGLRETAGLITGAALIMVVVFGAFASGQGIVNQQVGFGLAVAIFLDATLVRSVLVPASMEVLGKGNWFLPSWLDWLPTVQVEASEDSSGAK